MLYMYSLCAAVIALSLPLVVAIPEFNDINILVVTDAHSWISKVNIIFRFLSADNVPTM